MNTLSVGFVGLGSMGLGMAKNALKAGLTVKGFDVFEGARLALEDAGGTTVATLQEAVRDVDVLLLMVVNAAQARDALFGEQGAAKVMNKGAVVMVCCTIAPRDAREIGKDISAYGLLPLDAPVSGGKVGAEAGTLTIMASGPKAAFDRARPLIEAVSGTLYEVGAAPGLGATYKVVHQLPLACIWQPRPRSWPWAQRPAATATFCSISSLPRPGDPGCSWTACPHMLDDDFSPRSMVDIFVKDLGLVIETGSDTKTPLPLAAAAHQLFLAASSMGHGRIDDSAVVKVYESATGVPVKRSIKSAAE